MREIKSSSDNVTGDKQYLPVLVNSSGKMVCICNYELIKQDEDTWRCTGGGHEYKLDKKDPDIVVDVNGNFHMKVKMGGL